MTLAAMDGSKTNRVLRSMPDLLTASNWEKLCHDMRQDLATSVPETQTNELLMCCACGRLLPQDNFCLEYLIRDRSKFDMAKRAWGCDPDATRLQNLTLSGRAAIRPDRI